MIPCRSLALPLPTHVWVRMGYEDGRNFCAHRWLTQLVPHGSPHEFREYSLGKERQQKYDAKATKLVSGY
ncbi:hypothetical protein M405DRAFT_829407 [Rhizopogon salebrosus TDB-379]|nr:hypothetical protein M405DRAFT_829407 [Rhizopogon salebrosus TDB-379]